MAVLTAREVAFGVLGAIALCAILLVALAAWLAARSRGSGPRRPRRKTLEHGHRLAGKERVRTVEAAAAALRKAPVGDLVDITSAGERIGITLKRRKGQPCAQATGYLAGIFESAWAHEVSVTHVDCAGPRGGSCYYAVQRAPIGSGLPRGGASIPGSPGDPRRSPPTRAGDG